MSQEKTPPLQRSTVQTEKKRRLHMEKVSELHLKETEEAHIARLIHES